MVEGISSEQVRAQVRKFWGCFSNRSAEELSSLYFSNATVIAAFAKRGEPARLVLARRFRAFDDMSTSTSAELGPIEVQLTGNVAIASYTYNFRLVKANHGVRTELEVPASRGTQIFVPDEKGMLRIVHEHFSSTEPGKKKEIPMSASLITPAQDSRKLSAAASTANVSPPHPSVPTNAVPEERIRAAVRKNWRLFCNRSVEEYSEMYLPQAVLFAAGTHRSEPKRLAMMRRAREVFGSDSAAKVEIGAIELQYPAADVAIASYPLSFRVVRVLPTGKRIDSFMPSCRATQVFLPAENGGVGIFHEHTSSATLATARELKPEEAALAR